MSGPNTTKSRLHVLLTALAMLVALACASTARAQYAVSPPVQNSIDANSVNLDTGELITSSTDVSIGPAGHRGLRYTRQLVRKTPWNIADVPVLFYPFSNPSVIYEGKTYNFTSDSSGFHETRPTGATLTTSSGSATFIAGDGTVVTFTIDYYPFGNVPVSPAGRASSIVYPDGITKTFTYKSGSNICTGGPCNWYVNRLSSINLSNGYQLKFEYLRDTIPYNWGTHGEQAQWLMLSRVVAVNNAVEYCSPSADECSVSASWPQATYSYDYAADYSASGMHVADPESRVTDYAWNTAGQLTSVHVSGASVNLSEITYSTVSGSTYKVASIKNAGQTWNYSYDTSSSPNVTTTVVDPLSHSRVAQFTGSEHLKTSDTDENGYATSSAYCLSTDTNCPLNLLKKVTLPEGNATQYEYDARGNVTKTSFIAKSGSGLANLETRATYDASCSNAKTCNQPNTTTALTAPSDPGQVTNYEYDASSGLPSKVTLPAPTSGATRPEVRTSFYTLQAWVKNSSGSLVLDPSATRYPASQSTCITGSAPSCVGTATESVKDYSYTSLGDLGSGNGTNVLDRGFVAHSGNNDSAQTTSTAVAYDSVGNPVGQTDGLGNTWSVYYNKARQVKSTSTPNPGTPYSRPRITYIHYGANGLPDSVEQDNMDEYGVGEEYLRNFGYDDYNRLTSEQLSYSGGFWSFAIYSMTQTDYDPLGRVSCKAVRMEPSVFSTVLSYSACNQGPQGGGNPDRISHFVWENAGGLDRIQSGYGTTLQGDEVHYLHNTNGKTTAMYDAKGNVTSYAYDGHDRVLRTCYNAVPSDCQSGAASDFVQLTYDSYGRLTNKGLRGSATSFNISYVYDNLGRLTNANYPGGGLYDAPVTYTYDNLGEVLSAVDTNGHTATFGYDALGRVTSQGDAISVRNMQYDAAGRRTRLTWPDGRYVTYQYDANGAMTAILENGSSALATFAYDDFGRRASLTRGNGVVTSYSGYTPLGPGSITNDLAGTTNDVTLSLSYNAAAQIVSRTTSSSNSGYTFNENYAFNRTYTVNALNQYTASGSVTPTYDVKGNLTSAGTPSYTYSTKNELVGRGDTGASFYHDPLGRLDTLTVSSTTTKFQYDGAQISTELNGSNSITERYVWGPGADEPLVQYDGSDFSTRRYLVADERGSVIAVTDGSGNPVGTVNSYDEYGIPASTNQGRFQYTGQAWLGELGLYSYKARIYSPTMGRFLQTDPAGYPDGPNWYNYANADPVNATDPSGQDCVDSAGGAGCNFITGDFTRGGGSSSGPSYGTLYGTYSGSSGGGDGWGSSYVLNPYARGGSAPPTNLGMNIPFRSGLLELLPQTLQPHDNGPVFLTDIDCSGLGSEIMRDFGQGASRVGGKVAVFGGLVAGAGAAVGTYGGSTGNIPAAAFGGLLTRVGAPITAVGLAVQGGGAGVAFAFGSSSRALVKDASDSLINAIPDIPGPAKTTMRQFLDAASKYMPDYRTCRGAW